MSSCYVHDDGGRDPMSPASFTSVALFACTGLFVGALALTEVGRRIGLRQRARDPEGALAGTGAVDGAIFALLGLLVAFTFSGAGDRFDARRHLIVEETNAIGTAYLRIDLLPVSAQPPLRDLFRRYVDARLETYRALPDIERVNAKLAETTKLQGEIWSQSIAATRMDGAAPSATILVANALNAMIDITTTRTMATRMHPPLVIFGMLFGLTLEGALLAGYGMAARKSRSWMHIVGFAAISAIAVYVISDLEYPRAGIIRVDSFDDALVELRSGMK